MFINYYYYYYWCQQICLDVNYFWSLVIVAVGLSRFRCDVISVVLWVWLLSRAFLCFYYVFLVPAIAVTLVCRFSQRIYKQVFCNNTGLVRDLCCCSQQARPAVSLCNPAVRLDPVVKQDRRSCFTTGSQPDGCKSDN